MSELDSIALDLGAALIPTILSSIGGFGLLGVLDKQKFSRTSVFIIVFFAFWIATTLLYQAFGEAASDPVNLLSLFAFLVGCVLILSNRSRSVRLKPPICPPPITNIVQAKPHNPRLNQNRRWVGVVICAVVIIIVGQCLYLANRHANYVKSAKLSHDNREAKSGQFVFSPEFCEFSVTFTAPPSISEVMHDGGVKSHRAEVRDPTGSYFRAEVCKLPFGAINQLTKESAFADLSDIVTRSGCSRPEYFWELGKVGPIASFRATKVLQNSGRQIAVTYYGRQYYGSRSIISVIVACPASDYPTYKIKKFLNSVTVKEQ